MNNLKYYVYILLLIGFSSCDEDRFSSTKVIEFPDHVSKLAVTSNLAAPSFDPNDNVFEKPQAFVGHSLGIVEDKEYDVIDDATVKLFKDGDLFFDMTHDSNDNNYYGPINAAITEGNYTMEISAPGYDDLSATQTMPSKANIVGVTYEFEKVPFDFDNDLYDLLKVKISDPEGEDNYYAYEVYYELQFGLDTFYNNAYPYTDEPLVEYGYSFNEILPDITFNGSTHTLRLLQQSKWQTQNGEELVAVHVVIHTLSKDLYFYDTTRSLSLDAQGNPFAEPVLVHSNFKDGYGIFGLSNSTVYRHEF